MSKFDHKLCQLRYKWLSLWLTSANCVRKREDKRVYNKQELLKLWKTTRKKGVTMCTLSQFSKLETSETNPSRFFSRIFFQKSFFKCIWITNFSWTFNNNDCYTSGILVFSVKNQVLLFGTTHEKVIYRVVTSILLGSSYTVFFRWK